MRIVAIIPVVLLTACASSHLTPSQQSTETVRIIGGTGTNSLTLAPSADPIKTRISLPLAEVWRQLPAVYDGLGIGITTIEPKTHVVANEGTKVRIEMGKVPMSKYVDCGATQVGPNADSYEIYLVVITQLKADGESATQVTTSVEAAARPVAFPGDYARCRSKGALERRIAELAGIRATP